MGRSDGAWVEVSKRNEFRLLQLYKSGVFKNYKYFLLVTNDTEFERKSFVSDIIELFEHYPKIGLLSPCSEIWGEVELIPDNSLKCFWYIHNTAYFLRRELIEDIMENSEPTYLNFLFDGSNFRGYGADTEIITKGYINDWASAITNRVWVKEMSHI